MQYIYEFRISLVPEKRVTMRSSLSCFLGSKTPIMIRVSYVNMSISELENMVSLTLCVQGVRRNSIFNRQGLLKIVSKPGLEEEILKHFLRQKSGILKAFLVYGTKTYPEL